VHRDLTGKAPVKQVLADVRQDRPGTSRSGGWRCATTTRLALRDYNAAGAARLQRGSR